LTAYFIPETTEGSFIIVGLHRMLTGEFPQAYKKFWNFSVKAAVNDGISRYLGGSHDACLTSLPAPGYSH